MDLFGMNLQLLVSMTGIWWCLGVYSVLEAKQFSKYVFFQDGIGSKHPNSDLSIYTLPTADGRTPAPAGMYKTL